MFSAKVAKAWQNGKIPPYGIHPKNGKLRKPREKDMTPEAWADKQKAETAKSMRKANYDALSPKDKDARAKQKDAERQKHITDGTKEKER